MFKRRLKSKRSITAWLESKNIENYQLSSDPQYGFVVDVNGNVDLIDKNLTHIPVKFAHVTGSFVCDMNRLKSLLGAPDTVGVNFSCSHNAIKSLEGGPSNVGKNFCCDNNDLKDLRGAPSHVGNNFHCEKNQITSLELGPQTVGRDYQCSDNRLINLVGAPNVIRSGSLYCERNALFSLLGCPQHVKFFFNCDSNDLQSLEYCPESVGRLFSCDNNPSLKNYQNVKDFNVIYAAYLEIANIKKDRQMLELVITTNSSHQKIINKI